METSGDEWTYCMHYIVVDMHVETSGDEWTYCMHYIVVDMHVEIW